MELHSDIVSRAIGELNLLLHAVPEELTTSHVSVIALRIITDQWRDLNLRRSDLALTPALYDTVVSMFTTNVVDIIVKC